MLTKTIFAVIIFISKVAGIIFPAMYYLDETNKKICQWMKVHNTRSDSTAVIVNISGKEAEITNLGDSRAYLLRDNKLQQLSEDHMQRASFQKIPKEAGATSIMEPENQKNIFIQYLGVFADGFKPELFRKIKERKDRDIILLCSDGFTGKVEKIIFCLIKSKF